MIHIFNLVTRKEFEELNLVTRKEFEELKRALEKAVKDVHSELKYAVKCLSDKIDALAPQAVVPSAGISPLSSKWIIQLNCFHIYSAAGVSRSIPMSRITNDEMKTFLRKMNINAVIPVGGSVSLDESEFQNIENHRRFWSALHTSLDVERSGLFWSV